MTGQVEERLEIAGPAGNLEARLNSVEQGVAVAVICHPHPLHGGTLQNKVVYTLMRAARDQGADVLRFNFRGVGRSEGEHAEGAGEIDDCLAVVEWARQRYGDRPLWLMGFSFGGYVAAAAAGRCASPPEKLLLVAPSVERLPFAALLPLPVPATVMMGEADDVVASAAVFGLLADRQEIEMVRFPETGHFFHGRLVELKEAVEKALGS